MTTSRLATVLAVVATASVVATSAEASHRPGHRPLPSPTPTPTPTPAPQGCGFKVVPSPNASSLDNMLHDVAVLSATDAWAVGQTQIDGGGRAETLIQHWDGSAWRIVPSPNRLLTTNNASNVLQGVAAIAPDDVWAVGYTVSYDAPYRTLAMHWDGSRWSIVDTPSPGSPYNALNDVTAVGPNDVWAVGGSPILATAFQPFDSRAGGYALHWDGRTWSAVPGAPGREASSTLAAATAVSSSEVWAAGPSDPWRWNGSQWLVPPSGPYYSQGIDAAGPTHVWTVGFAGYGGFPSTGPLSHASRWDGSAWRDHPATALGVGRFLDVAVRAPGDVIAVGNAGLTARAARWNGSAWQALPAENGNPAPYTHSANDNILAGVDSAPDGSTWAVGYFWNGTGSGTNYGSARTLVERLSC